MTREELIAQAKEKYRQELIKHAQEKYQEEQKPSMLESGLRGAGQGITAGLSDELMGLLTAKGITEVQKEKGEKQTPYKELYQKYRDIQRQKNKASSEANPITYGASDLVASLALPLGSAKTYGKAIRSGMALGGTEALGRSEADLTKGEVAPLAKDVAVGATIGGVVNPLMKAVTPTRTSMYESAVNQSNPTASELQRWGSQGVTKADVGKTIMESGGLKPSSTRTLQEKIQPALKTTGEEISSLVANPNAGKIKADDLIKVLEEKLNEKTALSETKRGLRRQIQLIKDKYEGQELTPKEVWEIIKGSPKMQGFDESINYLAKGNDQRALSGQDLLREGRSVADNFLDATMQKEGKLSKQDFARYKELKQKYGNLKKAEEPFTTEMYKKQEPIGARNVQTTAREKLFDPIADYLRYAKTSIQKPYFSQPEWLTTLESAPFIRGQKATTLASPFYTKDDENE